MKKQSKGLDPAAPSDLQPGAITDRAGYEQAKAAGQIAELAAPGPLDPPLADLEYIGPDPADSPVFGLLVRGQRYQAHEAFAEYLVERHPDHWKRPDA